MPDEPHRLDQLVDPAGRDAADPGLLDHRHQRLLAHLPRLQERREVGALAQLGHPQLQRARAGCRASGLDSRCGSSAAPASARAGRRRSGPPHRLSIRICSTASATAAESRRHRPSAAARPMAICPRSSGPPRLGVKRRNSTLADEPDDPSAARRRRAYARLVAVAPARRLRLEFPPPTRFTRFHDHLFAAPHHP